MKNRLTLDITSKTVNVDERFTLTATITPDDADDKTLTWSSTNEQVAIIKGNDGMTAEVTATGVGTATITAMTINDKKAECKVTVHGQKLALKTSVGSGEVLQGDRLVLTMMDEDRNEVTDATIYYTIDGSAPTEQSTVYTPPIVLEKSFTLRAIAKGQRYVDCDELQETYTVIEDDSNESWVDEEQGLTYTFNTSDTTAKLMLVDNKTEGGRHALIRHRHRQRY